MTSHNVFLVAHVIQGDGYLLFPNTVATIIKILKIITQFVGKSNSLPHITVSSWTVSLALVLSLDNKKKKK